MIQWVAALFTLWSVGLYGVKRVGQGAVVGILGNICWVIWSLHVGGYALALVDVAIFGVNSWNLWKAHRG